MKRKFLLFLLVLFSFTVKAQFYSFSTNVVGDATLNFNIEYSMTMNRKWSMHLPVTFNPLIYKSDPLENMKFQNLTFMPGVRYWFEESYRSKFIGIYGISSVYHISKIFDKNRYDGNAFGLGISYGSDIPLSKRWNIEWELGVGVVNANYDKYRCKKCGAFIEHKNQFYFLPTKIAMSAVYLF